MIEEPVLITGGCGFVGRNLSRYILKKGCEVHIVDNLTNGQHPSAWLHAEYDQINDPKGKADIIFKLDSGLLYFYNMSVRDFFRRYRNIRFGDVYHLAAIIGGRTTIEDEPLKVATDLSIDAQFFNWVTQSRPARILYTSSSAVYPTHLQNCDDPPKLREDHIQFEGYIGIPDMTYGWAKLTGEYLARLVAQKHDLNIAVVRPFSGYGEDQDFSYPVPAIARRAYQHQDPLTIWGSGKQVRDFIHIDDCITAMNLALDRISDASAVNIGTGKPTDFYEVARIFGDLAGYNPEIRNLPDKPEGPKFRCADITKMEKILGWKPSISINEGFKRVLSAMKERIKSKI